MYKKNRRQTPRITRVDQIQAVLKSILTWEKPADVVLSQWFRQHRQVGGKDRHEIAESVFYVLRHLRRLRQYAQSGAKDQTRRLAILGWLGCQSNQVVMSALEPEEQQWLQHLALIDENSLAPAVRYSLPDWLWEQLASFPQADALLASLNTVAPLDLRVNTLKCTRDEALATVQEYDDSIVPTPYSPLGLRSAHKPAVNRWPLFMEGAIEVQDEGSQLLGLLLQPKRGEMVVDFCAGSGGKTLLLGALMRSTGRLYAFDVAAARLARAKPRFARSGLSNVMSVVIQPGKDERVQRLRGKIDRVLVDAPCTGLGTLRRNPDLKWRQKPADLEQLVQVQADILQRASQLLKVGGRLVYSTCSLLPQENEHQIAQFLERNPQFVVKPVNEVLRELEIDLQMPGDYLQLRPDVHQTDGFFAAILERQA